VNTLKVSNLTDNKQNHPILPIERSVRNRHAVVTNDLGQSIQAPCSQRGQPKTSPNKKSRKSSTDHRPTLNEEIIRKFQYIFQTDQMSIISHRDPNLFKNITYCVETELYQYKRKLFPKSEDNLGDGFSTFYDNTMRMNILAKIKEILKQRAGLSGQLLLDNN